jgi:DNA polymerase-3 subunit alpha
MQVKFIEGAVANGVPQAVIEKFWKDLLGFADYCFNKSHSACYGLTSYWTAYLKAHYPSAFMAALMTSDYDDTDRLSIEITECQKMGIAVLQPDVTESYHEFAVVPDPQNPDNRKAPVRFGMDAIKNVGTGAVEEILRVRKEGGFANLEEFLEKCSTRLCNRKALESLVKAGAFDRFDDRSVLLHNLDLMLAYGSRLQKEANSGQTDLFGNVIDESVVLKPQLALEKAATVYNQREQLLWERELLGLYLSQHPLSMFKEYLEEQTMPLNALKPVHDGKAVTVGGGITDMREITTKNGAKMAFVKIEDQFGEIELILFPNAYQQTTGLWVRDRVVLCRGKISAKDREGNIGEELKVLVDDAREITAEQAQAYTATGRRMKLPGEKRTAAAGVGTFKGKGKFTGPGAATTSAPTSAAPKIPPRLYVRLNDSNNQEMLVSLKQILDGHQGSTEVVLVLGPADSKQVIKLPVKCSTEEAALAKLRDVVGHTNIKLQ